MKKLLFVLVLFSSFAFSQENKLSEPSMFINKTAHIKITSDENQKASFKSGLGESVLFFASEITNLKNDITIKGLQIESTYNIGSRGMATLTAKEVAWVGLDEINDMLYWFETYVIPNLNYDAGKKKNLSFIFNSKEVTIKFEIQGKYQIFSVILKNSIYPDKYFWTESKVDDIPKVISTLKSLSN